MQSHFRKLTFNTYQRNSENGFTLIEILVSIVILSFGLLGMVGIQALALKSNADAKLQSSAVRLGRELGDMMRGNKAIALKKTPAENPYLIEKDFSITNTDTVNNEPCFSDGPSLCTTPLKIAQWEIDDWAARLNKEFPGARVKVCLDTAPYDADGLPRWDCDYTGTGIAIKIGWIRDSTNKTRVNTGNTSSDASTNDTTAFNRATRPSMIYSLTPGSDD
jgi:type IV pilus assembly protein PilV